MSLAFHREKVSARRLAVQQGFSLVEALEQVLQASAGVQTLDALLTQRRNAQLLREEQRLAHRRASVARFHEARNSQLADSSAWQGWFDGSAVPNPGQLGLGIVLRDPAGCSMHFSQPAGYGDSTLAEYRALILLLEQALLAKAAYMVVHGDSQVVIQDLLGSAPIGRLDCGNHRLRAQYLMSQFAVISLIWIPRAKNCVADMLARDAFVQNSPANV